MPERPDHTPSAATPLELGVVLSKEYIPGQRYASIMLDGSTVFSKIVYDNREFPAEENITRLFASRLRRLLEDE